MQTEEESQIALIECTVKIQHNLPIVFLGPIQPENISPTVQRHNIRNELMSSQNSLVSPNSCDASSTIKRISLRTERGREEERKKRKKEASKARTYPSNLLVSWRLIDRTKE